MTFPRREKGGSRVQRLALTRGDLGAPAQQYPAPSHFPQALAQKPLQSRLCPLGHHNHPQAFSPPPPPGTSYNLTGFLQRCYQILKVIVPNLPGPRPWRLIQWGLKPTFLNWQNHSLKEKPREGKAQVARLPPSSLPQGMNRSVRGFLLTMWPGSQWHRVTQATVGRTHLGHPTQFLVPHLQPSPLPTSALA